jgi:hypothetical protein
MAGMFRTLREVELLAMALNVRDQPTSERSSRRSAALNGWASRETQVGIAKPRKRTPVVSRQCFEFYSDDLLRKQHGLH